MVEPALTDVVETILRSLVSRDPILVALLMLYGVATVGPKFRPEINQLVESIGFALDLLAEVAAAIILFPLKVASILYGRAQSEWDQFIELRPLNTVASHENDAGSMPAVKVQRSVLPPNLT